MFANEFLTQLDDTIINYNIFIESEHWDKSWFPIFQNCISEYKAFTMKLTDDEIKRIEKTIELRNDCIIVIIDENGVHQNGDKKNRNVYRINKNDEIIWQIAPIKSPMFDNETFYYLNMVDDKIRAQNFSGEEFEVDIETGEARFLEWHK